MPARSTWAWYPTIRPRRRSERTRPRQVDGARPRGRAMNAAAVLALSVGHAYGRSVLGPDVKDRDGQVHRALTAAPLPILKADWHVLREIVGKVLADPEVFLVDFTTVAQA